MIIVDLLPETVRAIASRKAIATATFSPPLMDFTEISPLLPNNKTSKFSFIEISVISRLK